MSLLRLHGFRRLSHIAFQDRTTMYVLKKAQIRAINFRCAKVFQPDSFILFEIQPLSFAPDLKRLPDLLCMGSNTSLHTQVSVSLVPYKLNVSYFYSPFWLHALLHSNHRHVSATHVAILRAVKTRIKINLQCVGIISHLKNYNFCLKIKLYLLVYITLMSNYKIL